MKDSRTVAIVVTVIFLALFIPLLVSGFRAYAEIGIENPGYPFFSSIGIGFLIAAVGYLLYLVFKKRGQ